LISFGALIGKVTPSQMLVLAFFEIIFYSLNILTTQLKNGTVDMGGSIVIHTFGAFFGLAASFFLSPPVPPGADLHKHKTSRYTSDLFAMIGTIFLWILWPSFNAALAYNGSQPRVVINTLLSLIASCTSGFTASRLLRPHGKRFDMIDIQNATLAGGVAVGSSSDLVIGPGGALLIGLTAGTLSTVGFNYIGPWVERKLKIQDTCGILNLHGLPGILGGLAGTIACATAKSQEYGISIATYFPHGTSQAPYQIYGLLITLGISISSGLLVGFVVSKIIPGPKQLFQDSEHWEVSKDYSSVGVLKTENILAATFSD